DRRPDHREALAGHEARANGAHRDATADVTAAVEAATAVEAAAAEAAHGIGRGRGEGSSAKGRNCGKRQHGATRLRKHCSLLRFSVLGDGLAFAPLVAAPSARGSRASRISIRAIHLAFMCANLNPSGVSRVY